MTLRKHGKAAYANLATRRTTCSFTSSSTPWGGKVYTFAKKWVDSGDWVGIVGHPFRTQRGESPPCGECVLPAGPPPLPEKWNGLKDTEVATARYTDLIATPTVRETFGAVKIISLGKNPGDQAPSKGRPDPVGLADCATRGPSRPSTTPWA